MIKSENVVKIVKKLKEHIDEEHEDKDFYEENGDEIMTYFCMGALRALEFALRLMEIYSEDD